MEKTATTNIYNLIILDESGSMTSIERQAVSAMNETFQTVRNAQREHPECRYFVSLVVFEGNGVKGVRTVRDRMPVENIPDVRQEEYRPGSCTPLHDAMGIAIRGLERTVRKDDPVLVTVITDGMENSSEEYSGRAIKELVARKRRDGWTFAYIGANQDAEEVAHELAINNALEFQADEAGTLRMSKTLGAMAEKMNCRMASPIWRNATKASVLPIENIFDDLDV